MMRPLYRTHGLERCRRYVLRVQVVIATLGRLFVRLAMDSDAVDYSA
jgi:hypothetical protein